MNASELTKERSELLARIEQINEALVLLGAPAAAVEIWTSRNLRNTGVSYYDGEKWADIMVYSDQSLTTEAAPSSHGGFITAEDAAQMTVYNGWVDDKLGKA